MIPRQKLTQNTNNSFKLNFSSSKNIFSKINFTKTDANFETHPSIRPDDEDIYYDEVIYYDGGGVDGYGY